MIPRWLNTTLKQRRRGLPLASLEFHITVPLIYILILEAVGFPNL